MDVAEKSLTETEPLGLAVESICKYLRTHLVRKRPRTRSDLEHLLQSTFGCRVVAHPLDVISRLQLPKVLQATTQRFQAAIFPKEDEVLKLLSRMSLQSNKLIVTATPRDLEKAAVQAAKRFDNTLTVDSMKELQSIFAQCCIVDVELDIQKLVSDLISRDTCWLTEGTVRYHGPSLSRVASEPGPNLVREAAKLLYNMRPCYPSTLKKLQNVLKRLGGGRALAACSPAQVLACFGEAQVSAWLQRKPSMSTVAYEAKEQTMQQLIEADGSSQVVVFADAAELDKVAARMEAGLDGETTTSLRAFMAKIISLSKQHVELDAARIVDKMESMGLLYIQGDRVNYCLDMINEQQIAAYRDQVLGQNKKKRNRSAIGKLAEYVGAKRYGFDRSVSVY